MNERTRYQVTGSIFLIALAVIFLPMVFDGAGAPMREAPPIPAQQTQQSPLPRFSEVVPDSDVVERVEALRAEVDDEGFTTDTGTLFGEPVLTPADEQTRIWAVQAASFANRDNALAFRDQLRGAGYEAFISSVKDDGSDGDVMYRVAVGPLLSSLDAESIQSTVGAKFDVQPAVVEMSE